MITLYVNGKDDHYSEKIREWLQKYGIEYSEQVLGEVDRGVLSKLITELSGTPLKGPTISGFSRVWSYLEISKRPRVICEELIWLGSNNGDSV